MKKFTALLVLFALLRGTDAYATTSTIDTSQPAQGSALSSSILRQQFQRAWNDITNIYSLIGTSLSLGANQLSGSLTGGAPSAISVPSCSTGTSALTWTLGAGFGCNSISLNGAAGGDLAGTYPNPTLANTSQARTDLGLGTSATVNTGTSGAVIGLLNTGNTFSGANTFSGINTHTALTKYNFNAASLPTVQTGGVVQIGQADTVTTRVELDSFAASGHFSCVRYDGTNASPTTIQSGDELCSLNGWAYNGTSVSGPRVAVRLFATQNWTTGAQGTKIDFATTPNSSTTLTSAFTIDNDGGFYSANATGGDKGVGTTNVASSYANYFAVTATGAIPSGATGVFSTSANALTLSTSGTAALTITSAQASTFAGTVTANGYVTINAGASTAPSALTISGAAVATNAALSNYFYVTLTNSASTAVSNPTNPTDGQNLYYEFTQNGTGTNLVSWGTAFDFGTAGSPTLSTAAGKVDVVGFRYSGRLSKWIYLGSQLGN